VKGRMTLGGLCAALRWASAVATAVALPAQVPQTAVSARHSGIAGVVHDSLGNPIRLANILADGGKSTTASDDSGRFDLRGLPSGRNGFTVLKVGYAPVSFEASLPPDSIVVLAINLRKVQALDTVNIKAERVNISLARTGFIERRRLGLGSFLAPEQVDSIADVVATPSQLLRGVRGIDLKCNGATCVPVSRGRAACLVFFVDGAPHGSAVYIDSIGLNPNAIAAIEVYDRSAAVPMEFQAAPPQKQARGFSSVAGCGAIVLWTKAHIPR
jgi:hypothetical protein